MRAVSHALEAAKATSSHRSSRRRSSIRPIPISRSPHRRPSWVKFTIRVDDPVVYFQNSSQVPFISSSSRGAGALHRLVPAEIDAVSLHAEGRSSSSASCSTRRRRRRRSRSSSCVRMPTRWTTWCATAAVRADPRRPQRSFFYFPTFEQQESASATATRWPPPASHSARPRAGSTATSVTPWGGRTGASSTSPAGTSETLMPTARCARGHPAHRRRSGRGPVRRRRAVAGAVHAQLARRHSGRRLGDPSAFRAGRVGRRGAGLVGREVILAPPRSRRTSTPAGSTSRPARFARGRHRPALRRWPPICAT